MSTLRPNSRQPGGGKPSSVGSVYRALLSFPKSADVADVDGMVDAIAQAMKAGPGFRSITSSVGALMGPGAEAGQAARIVEVDFETLEGVMAALQDERFQDTAAATEALGTTIFLYEVDAV